MGGDAFLAVLLSAFLHAAWNAWVKHAADPRGALSASIIGAAAPAVLVLAVTGPPVAGVLPWLAAAAGLNILNMLMMARAYAAGDFAVIYPLMRGLVPLLLALAAPLLFAETLPLSRLLGVVTVSVGIGALAAAALRRAARLELAAMAWTLPTAATTAAYVIVDAQAARLGGSPIAYAASASVVNALAMIGFERWRGRAVLANLRLHARLAAGCGGMSLLSYLLFVWALARAPVALAAALRESSILFAVLIAAIVLRERVGGDRLAAILLVVAGVVLIRA